MIKKFLLAIAIALPLTAFSQVKLGVVDTQAIFAALPETQQAQTTLDSAQQKYQEEYQKLQDEFQKNIKEYQELPADTPQSIKERREQSLNDLSQRIQQFEQTVQQDLARQQQTLLAPIQAKIQDAIKAVGDEGSYTMIFENMVPVYVGTGAEDVTAKVRAKLGI